MPYESSRQMGKLFRMEEQGKLKLGTAERFARHTPKARLKRFAKEIARRRKSRKSKGSPDKSPRSPGQAGAGWRDIANG